MEVKTKSKKCTCNKVYCKHHSKVKMVVMLRPEYRSSHKTTVFYSYVKYNRQSETTIINNMLNRLEKDFRNAFNCIIFYSTVSDKEIYRQNAYAK